MMLRASALAIVLSLVMLPAAPAAHAYDPNPAESAAALQASDLPAGAEVEEVDFSSGGYPETCQQTATGSDPSGTKARRSIVSFAQSLGWSWDSAVYVYPSASAAAKSYSQLKAAASKKCRPLVHGSEDEEGYTLSVISGDVPVLLKAKSGMPRFVVDSYLTGRSADPEADPLDRYSYSVYYLAGKTVLELSASTYRPMTIKEMEATRDLALVLAKRAARI